ncbi:hypothetical protein B4102_1097 [Heyndrickxia sporothermodurans]|uniref:Uncharacterized protein n=1 Tax=Heyndrickxia sporothermodurans TaxID=46224 RepID=A0A150KQG4_9BACI|nr:hypothetical protein B4102_1097 [Heyndrickxia sporothermodurans]
MEMITLIGSIISPPLAMNFYHVSNMSAATLLHRFQYTALGLQNQF